jgi:hypothetical protein
MSSALSSSACALVVTSISPPNAVLTSLRDGARDNGVRFVLVGDTKSPADFKLDGCEYFDVPAQVATNLKFAALCPTRHYARKNIGYLIAIRDGARLLIETDDDNYPRPAFFNPRERQQKVAAITAQAWVNVYRYFSDAVIWPRGLPLENVHDKIEPFDALPVKSVDCPIQQGLADENPDVDAVYRLLFPLPQNFVGGRRVALAPGAWCPFNSQNTTWWPEAFPLLYLPAYCSFRMTDIWRSFVAQRIASANGWHVLFHEATVWQDRNAHNLSKDFADEVPGYLNNARIKDALQNLDLAAGVAHIPSNLRKCYEALVALGVVGAQELALVDAWLVDLADIAVQQPAKVA